MVGGGGDYVVVFVGCKWLEVNLGNVRCIVGKGV